MGKEVQQQIALNLLSEGTQITGDLHASNDIRIDGELKGKIFTKGRLVIGQMAKVEGDVNSSSVDILGTMEGDIESTGTVSLRSKAIFTGTIKASYIAIEAGAIFNGECHIQREVQQK